MYNERITLCFSIFTKAIIGGLLLLDFLTQLAALPAIAFSTKRSPAGYLPELMTYILIFTVSISLLITGAGFLHLICQSNVV